MTSETAKSISSEAALDREPLPQRRTAAACLLLEEGPDGWTGLYCAQGREDGAETAAYLNRHYPDGLARLLPLGDLAALGGAPARCPRMDADGDYLPARDPAYPPEPEPTAREACAIWHSLHPMVDFSCLYAPGAGWTVWDAWARAPLGDAA